VIFSDRDVIVVMALLEVEQLIIGRRFDTDEVVVGLPHRAHQLVRELARPWCLSVEQGGDYVDHERHDDGTEEVCDQCVA
jgi:hypothetical protein